MKLLSVLMLSLFIASKANAQLPKPGTYIYNYCDLEYNKCMGKCKVRISGKKIWIYAPRNLSGIKEGELLEKGTLYRHPSGKWTINSGINKDAKVTEGKSLLMWIDFRKKQFWCF